VHCFYAEHFFVSVHRHPAAAIGGACATLGRLRTDRRLVAVYRLLDALVDSMFPFLSALGDREVVTPQRDMVATMMSRVVPIPGMTSETEKYVRDLYDHLIRINDMVDSYRDLLGGSLEAYMSMVSNRLNDVMKQLTIIATVFLPLTFLTGFFGQNLGWLVNRIGSLGAFLAFGVGTEVLAVVCLVILFRRRGWMGRRGG
jgi:magnesium transporter